MHEDPTFKHVRRPATLFVGARRRVTRVHATVVLFMALVVGIAMAISP